MEGKTLDLGGIYRFTVDITGCNTAAVLTVEKVGEQQLPPADITVNGTPMTQLDVDNYQLDLDLTQGQTLTLGGADAFTPAWIIPTSSRRPPRRASSWSPSPGQIPHHGQSGDPGD